MTEAMKFAVMRGLLSNIAGQLSSRETNLDLGPQSFSRFAEVHRLFARPYSNHRDRTTEVQALFAQFEFKISRAHQRIHP